jgi:hypothetical protein
MAKTRRSVKRHRLLVYYRLGQRLRTVPFLITLFSIVLLAIGWLGNQGIISGGNSGMMKLLWDQRIWLYVMIGAGLLMYLLAIYIARASFVEARPKTLRVKAGIIPVDISYARIRQIRLVSLNMQYDLKKLSGRDYSLIEGYDSATCTALDLQSVPKPFTPRLLRQMWHKFMFVSKGDSLMFIVDDPMVLNQQIDGYIAARQSRIKKNTKYLDPIERAAQEQAARAAKATKAEKAKQKTAQPQINLGKKR